MTRTTVFLKRPTEREGEAENFPVQGEKLTTLEQSRGTLVTGPQTL
ncbi:hypothetical protein ERJ70_07065 [Sediminibacillus dalangtanensis]|uniref:Uncharacterized protein n=1 Tax=Sediminibacillus dalangtanensis TaxID=2729421 RepID=A0ABX7VQ99_9BACI|nr:hypothetical protein [Sediminibacillus dalangtanensis]QTM99081.1 hypothetical protein ERJ70_07065 [Sediminibacillus dalangtanensis]